MGSAKQPQHEEPTNLPLLHGFDTHTHKIHIASDPPQDKNAIFIERIKVALNEQHRIQLGSFTDKKPPKGFAIVFSPEPTPAGSVVTGISTISLSKRYKLVLHIANYSTKPVSAEVWQL